MRDRTQGKGLPGKSPARPRIPGNRTHGDLHKARHGHGCRHRLAAIWLLVLALCQVAVAHASHTPQVHDSMRPLDGMVFDCFELDVHAVVMTIPDPEETRLARSFDAALAATVAGFQSQGYVLDGFSIHWNPREAPEDHADSAKAPPSKALKRAPSTGATTLGEHGAENPGLVVFRRDAWRTNGDVAQPEDEAQGAKKGPEEVKDNEAQGCRQESPGPRKRIEYFLVYLVGESPTYGIDTAVFEKAALCAAQLNGRKNIHYPDSNDPATQGKGDCRSMVAGGTVESNQAKTCTEAADPRTGAKDGEAASCPRDQPGGNALEADAKQAGTPTGAEESRAAGEPADNKSATCAELGPLTIIGPTFSGSMSSIALALSGLYRKGSGDGIPCDVAILSPSATVSSNGEVFPSGNDAQVSATTAPPMTPRIRYAAVAAPLTEQANRFFEFACGHARWGRRPKDPIHVAILSEESSFGDSVAPAFTRSCCETRRDGRTDRKESGTRDASCPEVRISASQFPINIASIRTEQSRRERSTRTQWRKLVPGADRLLEFNLDEFDTANDRPATMQPLVTSRSDELMLHRTFDALRLYRKPDYVVVAATEIRDRLFILSQVRRQLPNAIPVVLEMDYLMVHPDYRATSRGALVLPTSDSLVCLQQPPSGSSTGVSRLVDCPKFGDARKYPFPSDYAANVFRSILLVLLDRQTQRQATLASQGRAIGGTCSVFDAQDAGALADIPGTRPPVFVASLAGFQSVATSARDDGGRAGAQQGQPDGAHEASRYYPGSLVASQTRVAAQAPSYLLIGLAALVYLAASILMRWGPASFSAWHFSILRQLLYDPKHMGATLSSALGRRPHEPGPGRSEGPEIPEIASLRPRHHGVLSASLLLFALFVLCMGFAHLYMLLAPDSREFDLAHGRDVYAVLCIWLLYGCVAIVGIARISVLDERLERFIRFLAPLEHRRRFQSWDAARHSWVAPALLVPGFLAVHAIGSGRANSVDPTWPWWLGSVALGTGAAFMASLYRQHRMQRRLSVFLSKAFPAIQRMRGDASWPNYHVVSEPPVTPFNLKMRKALDLDTLTRVPIERWLEQSQALLDAGPDATLSSSAGFSEWEARLISELKLIAVTIRTSAWCAILAPLSVLLALYAFPPVYEAALTGVCVAMLLGAFFMTVYIVLRMETDPLFGRLFTRDGDTLTLGSSVRALWPKFAAMALVLLPIVAPDVWRWLNGLITSINSIQ